MNGKKKTARKLCFSAICLALTAILPFFTGQIPTVGNMLCPMHFPVFLCGLTCGAPWGLFVGAVAPFFRFALFGAPALYPRGVAMAFELAAYGFISGFLYRIFPKKQGFLYLALAIAQLSGRCVWGLVQFVISATGKNGFTFALFITNGFANALPGILLQLLLLPPLVKSLRKANLFR